MDISIGDKVLNVEYLKYIGDNYKWLKMNMQPFNTVKGVGECTPWNEVVTCFSVQYSDVKWLAGIPMHRNKIFNVKTGFDMDDKTERFLSVKHNKVDILSLVKSSVESSIKKGNEYSLKRIKDAEREIIKLNKDIESHIAFCNECGDYIIKECED